MNEWIEVPLIFDSVELSLDLANEAEERFRKRLKSEAVFSLMTREEPERLAFSMAFLGAVHASNLLCFHWGHDLINPHGTKRLRYADYRDYLKLTCRYMDPYQNHPFGEVIRICIRNAWDSTAFLRLLNHEHKDALLAVTKKSWMGTLPHDPGFEMENQYRIQAYAQALYKYLYSTEDWYTACKVVEHLSQPAPNLPPSP